MPGYEVVERLLLLPDRVIDHADIVEDRAFPPSRADNPVQTERMIEVVERLLLLAPHVVNAPKVVQNQRLGIAIAAS